MGSPQRQALWRYLLSEHVLLNAALLASYALLRTRYSGVVVNMSSIPFLKITSFPALEAQVAATLTVTAVARSMRNATTTGVIATLLGFAKLFVLINAAMGDSVSCLSAVIVALWSHSSVACCVL